jgi:DNA-binding NtrC family response regulator
MALESSCLERFTEAVAGREMGHGQAMIEYANDTEKGKLQEATAADASGVRSESGPSIFVVDDEPMVGELVATVLEMDGFNIRLFRNAAEALKAFVSANPRPALLLTDFVMDGLNGMELIEHCKRAHPTLKTILYSGNVGMEITQRYPVKPDFFIRKPFQPRNLVDMVRSVLAD